MLFLNPSGSAFYCSESLPPGGSYTDQLFPTEKKLLVPSRPVWFGRIQGAVLAPHLPPTPSSPSPGGGGKQRSICNLLPAPPLFCFCPNSLSELEHLRRFLCQEDRRKEEKGYVLFSLKIILCCWFYCKLLLGMRADGYVRVESEDRGRESLWGWDVLTLRKMTLPGLKGKNQIKREKKIHTHSLIGKGTWGLKMRQLPHCSSELTPNFGPWVHLSGYSRMMLDIGFFYTQ